jgi:hypothetical protein
MGEISFSYRIMIRRAGGRLGRLELIELPTAEGESGEMIRGSASPHGSDTRVETSAFSAMTVFAASYRLIVHNDMFGSSRSYDCRPSRWRSLDEAVATDRSPGIDRG